MAGEGVISLPSLRLDHFPRTGEAVAAGAQSGLTFAPEAGTQRLRDVINKISQKQNQSPPPRCRRLTNIAYFMLGLPAKHDICWELCI